MTARYGPGHLDGKGNDDYKYGEKDTVRNASQQDFDRF